MPQKRNSYGDRALDEELDAILNRLRAVEAGAQTIQQVVQAPVLSGSASVQNLSISGSLSHNGASAGFFGTIPAAQPSAYTQTYSTTSKTHSNLTATTVATTAATLAAYGYTQAQADAIPVAINALIADVTNIKQVLNSVIDDLQALGLLS